MPKESRTRIIRFVDASSTDASVDDPHVIHYEALSDRQLRGYEMWTRSQGQNNVCVLISEPSSVWWRSESDPNRHYTVECELRNRRGALAVEYRCDCEDFKKHGRQDCKHIFAERLRREEVRVEGAPREKRVAEKKAARRPARERYAYDGRTVRSSQRTARREMPHRIPELVLSLKQKFDSEPLPEGLTPVRHNRYRGGKHPAPASSQAAALVLKVACGLSASEIMAHYDAMIEDGTLPLRRTPSENTLSRWMNDERLTPVLQELLRISALPFIRREIGAIIDSSKVSQLMTAHYKEVEYNNHDSRPGADWVKCHTLVGVETLVVMAVQFSGVLGQGTHDSKYLEPLVETALRSFPIEYVLGDKAYLAQWALDWLAGDGRGIKAVIPIKKRWFANDQKLYSEALAQHVQWHDQNNSRDFQDLYRFRSKIEGLFSVLKRMADGYCWSRGRKRSTKNASAPCTAWMNELLCKFIYVNLRTTVSLEWETGIRINYLVSSRVFPAPDEPLLRSRKAA